MKPNHVCLADECEKLALWYQNKSCSCRGPNVDGGFVAMANNLKPKPNLLYIMACINGRDVSWIKKEATHSFISLKLVRKLGSPTCRAGKPIKVRFAKDTRQETKQEAMHVTF